MNIMCCPHFTPQPVLSCASEVRLHQADICLKIRMHLRFYGCCTILPHGQAHLPLLLVGQGQHEDTAGLRPQALCTPCSTNRVLHADKSHPCLCTDVLLCMFPVAVGCVIPCKKL